MRTFPQKQHNLGLHTLKLLREKTQSWFTNAQIAEKTTQPWFTYAQIAEKKQHNLGLHTLKLLASTKHILRVYIVYRVLHV